MEAAVDRMATLPGRKAIILAADFMLPRGPRIPEGEIVSAALSALAVRANRAGVTVHALSLQGLDEAPHPTEALARISGETGGTLVKNTNDLDAGLDRILELNRGYYLLGFRAPDSAELPGPIEVRVKRPGLRVHARKAGLTPGLLATGKPQPDPSGEGALGSPLALRDLLVDLYADQPEVPSTNDKTTLRFNLQVDLSQIRLAPQPDGNLGFDLHIMLGVLGPGGKPVRLDSNVHHYGVSRPQPERPLIRRYEVELTEPGYYQLRAYVRDSASDRAGTAARFIRVPGGKIRLSRPSPAAASPTPTQRW